MKRSIKISLILVSLLGIENVSAIEYTSIGAKSTAMGGTGVSNARPSMAGYFNPALLAHAKSSVEVSLGGGFTSRDNGVGESYEQLSDSKFQDTYEKLNADPTSYTQEDIDVLSDGKKIVLGLDNKGVLVNPDAYLSAQIYNFGIGIYAQTEGATAANVNADYDKLIVGSNNLYIDLENPNTLVTRTDYENSSLIYAVESGVDKIDVTGLILIEVPLSYGHNLPTKYGDIALGASLKLMQGTTYRDSVDFLSKDIQKEIEDTETKSSTFGIDLGFLYTPSMVEDLRVGLVAKNINSPAFKTDISADHVLDPMVRFGISYDVLESLEIALDSDLTSNKTEVPGFDVQYMGMGLNYHPFSFLSLGAGLMDNLASDLEGLIYTAGFGIGPEWLHLEISGQYASKEQTVEGVTYPTYSKINLGFVSTW